VRDAKRKEVEAQGRSQAEDRVLTALVGSAASDARFLPQALRAASSTKGDRDRSARCRRHAGARESRHARRQIGCSIIGDIFGKALGGRTKTRRMTVAASHDS
jgi:ATP-dependent HslUV protease ATP-binding subunit HslU